MKLRLSYWIIGCLLCLVAALQAQSPVIITGEAPFAKNEEIRLLVFDDLLNNVPRVAATDKIDKTGRFALKFTTNQIKLVQLAIRNTKSEFYVAPANTYHFAITTDSVLFNMINPDTYGGYLQLTPDHLDTNDINYKLNRFNYFFNEVMNEYAFRLTYDKDVSAYDTLMAEIGSRFPLDYDPLNFYHAYIYYSCGILDKLCFAKDPLKIYQRYFDNDYILYNNPAYMAMFANNYLGYLYNSKYVSKDLLTQAINESPDYMMLFNGVGRDPMLVNERVRELVIILNLIEFYNYEEFDQGNVVKLLQYIQATTHFPEHQIYVENALNTFTNKDTDYGVLKLANEKGKKTDLKQFEGMPIYVHIFQSDCIDCIREMMLIKDFEKKYGANIQFISLNVDADVRQYEQFCKKYGQMFDWPILYFDGSYDWLSAHGVETLPDYMLMDANGKITQRYAPSPDQGLAEYLANTFPEVETTPQNPMFQERK
ncbi:MAG: TlpA family protein disulfide reductase [Bacteroidales bacterium]|nr:TlpA family protein disulfide reductase [Bacteroidales bacterium]